MVSLIETHFLLFLPDPLEIICLPKCLAREQTSYKLRYTTNQPPVTPGEQQSHIHVHVHCILGLHVHVYSVCTCTFTTVIIKLKKGYLHIHVHTNPKAYRVNPVPTQAHLTMQKAKPLEVDVHVYSLAMRHVTLCLSGKDLPLVTMHGHI